MAYNKKLFEQQKNHATQLWREKPGLTVKEVQNLTGLSHGSAQRLKNKLVQDERNGTVPRENITPQPAGPSPTQDQASASLDFEDSPAPVEKKGVVDSALSSLKGMLGIADKKETSTPPIVSAKLDAKRQQFVDSATPTIALACMALASWLWGRIGPEYSQLAPDEAVAQRIVQPLLRIYARHANFMTDVNPDIADIGASMFALVGYVHVSLGIYQQIKAEKEDYEQDNSGVPFDAIRRAYRAAPRSEDRTSDEGGGHAPVSGGANGANGANNGANGGHPGFVNLPNLSDKEARQHAALSRLSALDYASRARRSGRT